MIARIHVDVDFLDSAKYNGHFCGCKLHTLNIDIQSQDGHF